jgi:putative membrane protein
MGEMLMDKKKVYFVILGIILIPSLFVVGTLSMLGSDSEEAITKDIKVAVVDNDQPVVFQGTDIHVGQDLKRKLEDNKQFAWHYVSEKTAETGLESGEYTMVVEVPSDFSHNVTTALEDEPQVSELNIATTPNKNYLASLIGNVGADELKNQLAETISRTYDATILDVVDQLKHGITTAADGSEQLDDGLVSAYNGTNELATNLTLLANGTSALKAGVTQLSDGNRQILNGLQKMHQTIHKNVIAKHDDLQKVRTKTVELNETIQEKNNELKNKGDADARTIKENLEGIKDDLEFVQANMENDLTTAITDAVNGTNLSGVEKLQVLLAISRAVKNDEKVNASKAKIVSVGDHTLKVADAMTNIATSTAKLMKDIDDLAIGSNKLLPVAVDVVSSLEKGLIDINNGLIQTTAQNHKMGLIEGVSKLQAGINGRTSQSLFVASDKLNSGSQALSAGSNKLLAGMTKLKNGTSVLSSSLKKGAAPLEQIHTNPKNVDHMVKPVVLKNKDTGTPISLPNAFAPLLFACGLFFGVLCIRIGLNIIEKMDRNSQFLNLGKFYIVLTFALIQGLVMILLSTLTKLTIPHLLEFTTITIAAAVTFAVVVSVIDVVFGHKGLVVTLILLILQFIMSNGLIPIELLPPGSDIIAKLLPVTYAVRAYSETIITDGSVNAFVISIIMLLLFIPICFVVYMLKKQDTVPKMD